MTTPTPSDMETMKRFRHAGWTRSGHISIRANVEESMTSEIKGVLSTCKYVKFTDKSDKVVRGQVLRRNINAMNVLPLTETDVSKYWIVSNTLLTAD